MKRVSTGVCILALAVLIPHVAGATTIWFAGAKAGINWSTVRGSEANGVPGWRTQAVAGGFGGVEVHKYIALRLEGLFYPKGAEVSVETAMPSNGGVPEYIQVNGTLSLAYVEFPLLLVGQLPVGEKAFIEAFAGPYYAYNLQTSFDVAVSSVTLPTGIDNLIKNSDTGLVLGLGISWDTEHFRTHLEGRFEYSLASIDEQDFDIRNETFAIIIGFSPIRRGE